MATAATRCSATSSSAPTRRSTPGPATGAPIGCASSTTCVKGAPLDEPAVRVFVMGGGSGRRNAAGHLEHGGRWITAADWPLPGVEFAAVPSARRRPAGPRAARSRARRRCRYDFDPAHPVPTIGGALSSLRAGRACAAPATSGSAGVLRLHAALPAARLAPRRAGVPDRRRSTRRCRSSARSRPSCASPPTGRTPTSPPS